MTVWENIKYAWDERGTETLIKPVVAATVTFCVVLDDSDVVQRVHGVRAIGTGSKMFVRLVRLFREIPW